MADGLYQSVVLYFFAWLVFYRGDFASFNGLDVADRERFGIFIAPAAVIACNAYVLMNTYRWDWLMVLITVISTLLLFFWTGVYSAFTASQFFYKAAPQVFGQAAFWAVTGLTTAIALLPRFMIKALQKVYFPYDVDIVREQVRLGKFDYLEEGKGDGVAASKVSSTSSSDIARPSKHTTYQSVDEDRRPIYPPSVAPTTTTHNPRSQNGSDGTEFTRHRLSMEPPMESHMEHPTPSAADRTRPSLDRARSSYERVRSSMDRMRPSYEASNDFTSAAMLTRMESSHSYGPANHMSPWREGPNETE